MCPFYGSERCPTTRRVSVSAAGNLSMHALGARNTFTRVHSALLWIAASLRVLDTCGCQGAYMPETMLVLLPLRCPRDTHTCLLLTTPTDARRCCRFDVSFGHVECGKRPADRAKGCEGPAPLCKYYDNICPARRYSLFWLTTPLAAACRVATTE